MLVSIPPKYSVSQIMGYLKGKSSLMIFEKYANLKYKYGNRHFWRRGYYVDTVGRNKRAIAEYIRNQLQEDVALDQMSYQPVYGSAGKVGQEKSPFSGKPEKNSRLANLSTSL
jgi:putative transposase